MHKSTLLRKVKRYPRKLRLLVSLSRTRNNQHLKKQENRMQVQLRVVRAEVGLAKPHQKQVESNTRSDLSDRLFRSRLQEVSQTKET